MWLTNRIESTPGYPQLGYIFQAANLPLSALEIARLSVIFDARDWLLQIS